MTKYKSKPTRETHRQKHHPNSHTRLTASVLGTLLGAAGILANLAFIATIAKDVVKK